MISRIVLLMALSGWLRAADVQAQAGTEVVQQALEKVVSQNTIGAKFPLPLKEFYQAHGFRYAWITNEPARLQLLRYLETAEDMGLPRAAYQAGFILSWQKKQVPLFTGADSLAADFLFTDAAIHFFQDLAFGSAPPSIGYDGLNYSPQCFSVPSLLSASLSTGTFGNFPQQVELRSPEYTAAKTLLLQYTAISKDTAQKKRADPVPAKVRMEELGRTLNTFRWLRCARAQYPHIIVVNIPSANLLVYDSVGVAMESKVIVGKGSNRTPTLCSQVTEVILYPYWMVPKKIATKEYLPLIKKNIGTIDANNFQVINDQGRVINPNTINWQELSAAYFPYTLRQSTGCDNSLGLVKLNFYSPFVVYLHDTPWKSLFAATRRFFSHGCIRVEKAMDLARLVMKDKTAVIDTLSEKGCLYNQRPITLSASEKMPVFVLYNTAWVDSAATVRFYGDVYNKFPRVR